MIKEDLLTEFYYSRSLETCMQETTLGLKYLFHSLYLESLKKIKITFHGFAEMKTGKNAASFHLLKN